MREQRYTNEITVGRLKELLADMPDTLVVICEGCDCEQEAGGVVVSEGIVIIMRAESLGGKYIYPPGQEPKDLLRHVLSPTPPRFISALERQAAL